MRVCVLVALLALPEPAVAQHPEGLGSATSRPVISEILSGVLPTERGFTGIVAASSETDLAFTVEGQLAERRVSTGAVVAAGDVLALLDPTDLEAELRGAEAGVRSAEAQLAQARDVEERAVELASRGVDTAVRQDAAETARVAAEARLEQALATREGAADRRAAASLLAPADGVILSVLAEPGATMSAGQPVLRFAATAGREVQIDLTDAELAALVPDAAFAVTLVVDPSITAHAKLSAIASTAARETRTREVSLTLVNPPEGLRLGALVTATPEGGATVMTLPASAVLAGEEGAAVWVVTRPEGRVSLVPVTTAPAPGDRVVILSGLEAGQEVVTRGVRSLTEGQIVGSRIVTP